MYLCNENYSERGSKRTTTEIINKPLNCIRGLFTFQPELRPSYYAPVLKSVLHRVNANIMLVG